MDVFDFLGKRELVQQPKPCLCFGIVILTIAEVAADAAATAAAMQPPSRKKQQEAPAIHNSTTQKTPTRKTQRLLHKKNPETHSHKTESTNLKP
jgi:hypothetical protein